MDSKRAKSLTIETRRHGDCKLRVPMSPCPTSRRAWFIFIFTLLPLLSFAQNYPVQLSTQLIAPFTGYIPDYASPGNDNLRVFALFSDFSHATYDVKLQIKIEGQGIVIQSQPWYYAGAFTLEPGVPLMLSGTDLAGLLNENNLQFNGITRQDYDQRKVLPEGFYTITITAYDFANPVLIRVSNDAVTQAWMLYSDPPFCNLPLCGSAVTVLNPQQLIFSWSPVTVVPSAILQPAEYTFELWEIFPAHSAPGNIVATTAPIYSVTTTQTLLSYGITEPPLVVGREYVWRVRATDLDGRQFFRNNGASAICTFTYGDPNVLLGNLAALNLSAQALTHRQARCTWDSLGVFASYHIQFRKVNTPNWFSLNTDRASLRITGLEPNCNYEAQVQGVFNDGSFGPWSNVANWHTPLPQELNCGEASPPPAQQNFHPLTQATVGMIWQVGQFEMSVTALNNLQSNGGWYSGAGKIVLPFGVTLACAFSNVQIGEDQTLYAGEVKAATNGITNWLLQYNHGYQYDTSYFYHGTIDSLYVNANGQVVILDANGNTTIVTIDTSNGALFTDSSGNQWIVNPDGSITFVTGGYLLPFTNDTLNAQEMRILKLAMTNIRNEISPGSISQKEQTMQSNRASLQTFIDNQQQSLPASPNAQGDPAITSDSTFFVIAYDEPGSPNDAGYTLGSNYKAAELDYYSLRVLAIMSREDCPDAELNFIGQYLTVNGTLYRQFVSQQLAAGKTEAQIAADVAQLGIKALVTMTLKKQMTDQ